MFYQTGNKIDLLCLLFKDTILFNSNNKQKFKFKKCILYP